MNNTEDNIIEIEHINNIEDETIGYIEKINSDIGYYWWKRYIYSAFWSNISTPINLSIVVLTALTTGQSATDNLISKELSTILGSVTLFISIFNSYFKPHEQLMLNQDILQKWALLGEEFDNIYYDKVYTYKEKKERLNNLEKLFKSVSSLKRTCDNNYCIDFLYIFIRNICIRKNLNWITIKNIGEISRQRRRSLDMTYTPINTSSIINKDSKEIKEKKESKENNNKIIMV